MSDKYKIAKPGKRMPGVKRVALVAAPDDEELGGVFIIFLRGDVRALMPAFGGGWHESEEEAVRHCEEEYGIPRDAWEERSGPELHDDPGPGPGGGRKRPARIPTDEAALKLCRTPKPSVSQMIRVVKWAEARPSGEKIQPLLVLQTSNRASRNGLHEEFHRALHVCARKDPSPLWHTIEHDWETYRVWHAILAVVGLDDRHHLRRLVALGTTPLLGIHWSDIAEAAAKHGVEVPRLAAEIQDALAGLPAGPWQWFERRRAAWPKELDPDPALSRRKRVTLTAETDEAAEDRATKLGGLLRDLGAALEARRPSVWEEFQRSPGATRSQLEELLKDVFGGGPLPPELAVLYRWHLGGRAAPVDMPPDSAFHLLTLDRAVAEWRMLVELKQDGVGTPFRFSWFPVLADGFGNSLVLETKGPRRGQLIEHWHDESGHRRRYRGLDEWAQDVLDRVAKGLEEAPRKRAPRGRPGKATAPVAESSQFEVDLSGLDLRPHDGVRRRVEVESFPAGTVLVWPGGGSAALKLGPGCWCFPAGYAQEQALDAIRVLARHVPQAAWRVDDAAMLGCLRNAGSELRQGRVRVTVLAANAGH